MLLQKQVLFSSTKSKISLSHSHIPLNFLFLTLFLILGYNYYFQVSTKRYCCYISSVRWVRHKHSLLHQKSRPSAPANYIFYFLRYVNVKKYGQKKSYNTLIFTFKYLCQVISFLLFQCNKKSIYVIYLFIFPKYQKTDLSWLKQ